MKKLYSLFAAVVMAVVVNAQTTLLSEDFASLTSGNNTSNSGSSTTWSGNENFITVDKTYQAGGAVRIGTSSAVGSITSKVLDLSTDGGKFTLKFDVKGWTTVEGNIIVSVTGQADETVTYSSVMSGPFETITLNYTGGVAGARIKIATSAKRAYIDNVIVETVVDGSLAVTDINNTKKTLVKNTQVDSSIVFAAKSDVKVYNVNGQVVKSASVNENTSLNVSTWPKGIYIVSGNVDGEAVSQKIIKK